MIPKRIICTHISQHTLEPKLKYCMHLMQEMHPKWEFLFFSDGDCHDFIQREMPKYLELYDWYPRPVQKADFFRLLVVYQLGGFYLDTDFMLEAPLDLLSKENAVFAFEHEIDDKNFELRYPVWLRTREEKLTVGNYAFGAMAGHPFLLALLDELVMRTETFEVERCNDLDVLHSTGPDAVTSVYYRHREQWKDVRMLKSDRMGFGKYGVHLVHGVWREDGAKGGH